MSMCRCLGGHCGSVPLAWSPSSCVRHAFWSGRVPVRFSSSAVLFLLFPWLPHPTLVWSSFSPGIFRVQLPILLLEFTEQIKVSGIFIIKKTFCNCFLVELFLVIHYKVFYFSVDWQTSSDICVHTSGILALFQMNGYRSTDFFFQIHDLHNNIR